MRVVERYRRQAKDEAALDGLSAYLQARAEWISNYRQRRREQQHNGSGQVEQANDLRVAGRRYSLWADGPPAVAAATSRRASLRPRPHQAR